MVSKWKHDDHKWRSCYYSKFRLQDPRPVQQRHYGFRRSAKNYTCKTIIAGSCGSSNQLITINTFIMRKIIVFSLFVVSFLSCFSQQTNPSNALTKEEYLQKSKHQKTAAWVLLGGGL